MMTPEEYEAKRNARYERMVAASLRAEKESAANWQQASLMADCIPFGQPILVGHHSETRDRNFRSRIESKHRKGYELHQKACEYASRADSIKNNDAIFSDDPQATEKLSEKIAHLEELQTTYKAVNAAYKKYLKNPASLDTCDLPESYKYSIRNFKPEWSGDTPIPSFRLTNNNANIRRLKERAAVVEKKQTTADKDVTIKGVKIEYRPSENRIRATFEGRVSKEVYTQLRQGGYRVAPSYGDYTFSAYYNYNAGETLRRIIEAIPA